MPGLVTEAIVPYSLPISGRLRSLLAVTLVGVALSSASCKTRTYNGLEAATKASESDGEFPEPLRASGAETYKLRRDYTLTSALTRGSTWTQTCISRADAPEAELPPGAANAAVDSPEFQAAVSAMESKVNKLTWKMPLNVMEKSTRPDTFPEETFKEAKTQAAKDNEVCHFNRRIPHALLGLNADAFQSNKDAARYEVNFRIDTEGQAGIDFYALFVKEGPDGELRKDSGLNVGLLRNALVLAKGMGAKTLTVIGSSVINAKIARVITKRYDFALVEGDGKSGSTFARRFDLSKDAPAAP